jgi:hypothetical protein
LDSPLPQEWVEKLTQFAQSTKLSNGQRNGKTRYVAVNATKLVRDAGRLIHALWGNKGKARIGSETFQAIFETKSRGWQQLVKKSLAQIGVLCPDWQETIRRHQCRALYRLTDTAMQMLERESREVAS